MRRRRGEVGEANNARWSAILLMCMVHLAVQHHAAAMFVPDQIPDWRAQQRMPGYFRCQGLQAAYMSSCAVYGGHNTVAVHVMQPAACKGH